MDKILKKFKTNYKKYPLIGSFFVFLTIFSLSLFFTLGTKGFLFKDDHFFHFKYAYLLRTYGFEINKNFDWMYLTEEVKNHTLHRATLFQIALIPFTFIRDLAIGIKISDAFWASSSLGVIYYSFRKLKVSYPFLMIALVALSYFSMERFLAGRTFVFSTGLIFLLFYFSIEKKYYKFFLSSLLLIFWHPSIFFIPFLVNIIVEISRYLNFGKINYYGIIGWIASVLIASFYFSFEVFLNIANFLKKILPGIDLGQGVEMQRLNIFKIAEFSQIFLLLMIFSFIYILKVYIDERKSEKLSNSKTLLIAYSAFLFLLFILNATILINGRFIDYYGVGVVFLTGACISYFKKTVKFSTEYSKNLIFGGIFIFLLITGTNTFNRIQDKSATADFEPHKSAAEWIISKSSNKDKIYLYNWSDFPINFFYNHKNIYAMGMEPMQLYYYDKNLYWKWYNIFNNGIYCDTPKDCREESRRYVNSIKNSNEEDAKLKVKENGKKIIKTIKDDFQAKYIISNQDTWWLFDLNKDLVTDSFSSKSKTSDDTIWVYELK